MLIINNESDFYKNVKWYSPDRGVIRTDTIIFLCSVTDQDVELICKNMIKQKGVKIKIKKTVDNILYLR